jgi:hypothetical protein
MFNGADVVELDSLHPLHEKQELQESQSHLLRVVMEKWVEQGEEFLQQRVAQTIFKNDAQSLE